MTMKAGLGPILEYQSDQSSLNGLDGFLVTSTKDPSRTTNENLCGHFISGTVSLYATCVLEPRRIVDPARDGSTYALAP
jgi:hypothetical protein